METQNYFQVNGGVFFHQEGDLFIEVKYIKLKAAFRVNAQCIQISNLMGTHPDAPRHFVTNGMTVP